MFEIVLIVLIVLIVIVLFDVFVTKIRKNEEARLQRRGESETRNGRMWLRIKK